ncbi:MAG: DEAD/DEAH box helicase [Spirochaetaceae bacterium]|jgi:superfamily II DNA/RNA helicase|nr:DEAD/DEAH box helicase [Spirochaetaceae bacterium]
MSSGTFADLNIRSDFQEKVRRLHITTPTTIQRLVIPRIAAGESILFRSATGTGKTFAYLLPLLSAVGEAKTGVRLLILAPTLELCSQIKREVDFLLADTPVKAALIIGSASLSRQIESIKKEKPVVLVGNPARLLLLVKMGKVKLDRVQCLVLDEGDKLVCAEQYAQTAQLCSLLNAFRQSVSCSATLSPQSRERLLPLLGAEAVSIIETDEQEILRDRITHLAFYAENRRKIKTLCSFLTAARIKKALVFTADSGQIGVITAALQYHKRAAAGISGTADKRVRTRALGDFRSGAVNVLIASDLAARGLDIPAISHVIALDVPESAEAYLHRAGRTARAGACGTMVSIGTAPEMRRLAVIEKDLGIVVYPRILYRGKIVAPAQD